ncbi:MAG: CaiB/BaiF CoA transferase family protein [Candidatus Methylomirabilales bacterium]|nr:CoA transferase [candidate division NC10 bacterium]
MGTLSGVTVLDLTRIISGPYGTMLLAFLGAEVIKIEEPLEGDTARRTSLYYQDGLSAVFVAGNVGKKSVTLNLKPEKGRALFLRLVESADVVIDNFRPGTMERLGLGYETLKTVNPRIIACSISGYGAWGPLKDAPAFDLTVQAMAGSMSMTGEKGRPPVKMGVPIGDLAAGMAGALGVTAALYRRERTGHGEQIDVAMFDVQVSLLHYHAQYYLASGERPEPVGSAHPNVVPYQAFKTRDGYLVVALWGVDYLWPVFCECIGRPDLVQDHHFETNTNRVKHRELLIPILEEIFHRQPTPDWMAIFEQHRIPAAPVHTIDEVLALPQVAARQMLLTLTHPATGTPLPVLGNPVKLGGDRAEGVLPPPLLGQHTEEVLTGWLGLSEAEVLALRQEKVI